MKKTLLTLVLALALLCAFASVAQAETVDVALDPDANPTVTAYWGDTINFSYTYDAPQNMYYYNIHGSYPLGDGAELFTGDFEQSAGTGSIALEASLAISDNTPIGTYTLEWNCMEKATATGIADSVATGVLTLIVGGAEWQYAPAFGTLSGDGLNVSAGATNFITTTYRGLASNALYSWDSLAAVASLAAPATAGAHTLTVIGSYTQTGGAAPVIISDPDGGVTYKVYVGTDNAGLTIASPYPADTWEINGDIITITTGEADATLEASGGYTFTPADENATVQPGTSTRYYAEFIVTPENENPADTVTYTVLLVTPDINFPLKEATGAEIKSNNGLHLVNLDVDKVYFKIKDLPAGDRVYIGDELITAEGAGPVEGYYEAPVELNTMRINVTVKHDNDVVFMEFAYFLLRPLLTDVIVTDPAHASTTYPLVQPTAATDPTTTTIIRLAQGGVYALEPLALNGNAVGIDISATDALSGGATVNLDDIEVLDGGIRKLTLTLTATDDAEEVTIEKDYTLILVGPNYVGALITGVQPSDGYAAVDNTSKILHVLLPGPAAVSYELTFTDAAQVAVNDAAPATVTVNKATVTGLKDGDKLYVIDGNGVPNEYTVELSQFSGTSSAETKNANLTDLRVWSGSSVALSQTPSGSSLLQGFAAQTLKYVVNAGLDAYVRIEATPAGRDAQVFISRAADAALGETLVLARTAPFPAIEEFTITVVSEDATEVKEYTVYVLSQEYEAPAIEAFTVQIGSENIDEVYRDDAARTVYVFLPLGPLLTAAKYSATFDPTVEIFDDVSDPALVNDQNWNLEEGPNKLTLIDAAGLPSYYTVVVSKGGDSSDASLADLELLSGYTEVPLNFGSDILRYAVRESDVGELLSAAATPTQGEAKVFINGAYCPGNELTGMDVPDLLQGQVSRELLVIKVLAPDHETEQVYTVFLVDDDYAGASITAFTAANGDDPAAEGYKAYSTYVDQDSKTLYAFLPQGLPTAAYNSLTISPDNITLLRNGVEWVEGGDLVNGDQLLLEETNGLPAAAYTVNVDQAPAQANGNAALARLTLHTGVTDANQPTDLPFTLAFDQDILTYAVQLGAGARFLKVDARAASENSHIFVDNVYYGDNTIVAPGLAIANNIAAGAQLVQIKVLAEDNQTERVYRVFVLSENAAPQITEFLAGTQDDADAYVTQIDQTNRLLYVFPTVSNISTIYYTLTVSDNTGLYLPGDDTPRALSDGLGDPQANTLGLTDNMILTLREEVTGPPTYYTVKILAAGAGETAALKDLNLFTGPLNQPQTTPVALDFDPAITSYVVKIPNRNVDTRLKTQAVMADGSDARIFINGTFQPDGIDVDYLIGTNDFNAEEGPLLVTVKVVAANNVAATEYRVYLVSDNYELPIVTRFDANSADDGSGLPPYTTYIDQAGRKLYAFLPAGEAADAYYFADLPKAGVKLLNGDTELIQDAWTRYALTPGDYQLLLEEANGLPSGYYTAHIIEAAANASKDATLSKLTLHSGASDDPASQTGYVALRFEPGVYDYTVALRDSDQYIKLGAESTAAGSHIFVNNAYIADGVVDLNSLKVAPIPIVNGTQLVQIRVLAADNKTELTYTVRMVRPDYQPAVLQDFRANSQVSYDGATDQYTVTGSEYLVVLDQVNRIVNVLLPKGVDPADIWYLGLVDGAGAAELAYPNDPTDEDGDWTRGILALGDNTLTLRDAANGIASTYKVTVTQSASTEQVCALDGLSLFTGVAAAQQSNALPLTFDPDITTYTVTIPVGAKFLKVVADPVDDDSYIFIKNIYCPDGELSSQPIDAGTGAVLCQVLVAAKDGLTTKTYTIYAVSDGYSAVTIDSFQANEAVTNGEPSGEDIITVVDEQDQRLYVYLPAGVIPSTVWYNTQLSDETAAIAAPQAAVPGQWSRYGLKDGDLFITRDKNGVTKEYAVIVKQAKANASAEASLDTLQLFSGVGAAEQSSEVELHFDPEIYSYIVTADMDHAFLKIQAEASQTDSLIFIDSEYRSNGISIGLPRSIAEKAPSTVYKVLVVAADGHSTATYTISVVSEDYQPVTIAAFQANKAADAGDVAYITAVDELNHTLSVFLPYGVARTSPYYCITLSDGAAKVFLNNSTVDIEARWGKHALSDGSTVTVSDKAGVRTDYTVKIYSIARNATGNIATLSDLQIFGGEKALKQETALGLKFDPAITAYTVVAPKGVDFVKLAAVKSDPKAYVLVNGAYDADGTLGGLRLAADDGRTTYEIMVVSANGTETQTYVVTVTRGEGLLSNLSATGLTRTSALSPEFASDIFNYVGYVGTGQTSTLVSATAFNNADSVDINCISGGFGFGSGTGSASATINLASGVNVIRVSTYDVDHTLFVNYYLSIYRPYASNKITVGSQNVFVDGAHRGLINSYNINGNNFLQLRDVAMLLDNTLAEFSVSVDNYSKNAALTSNSNYFPNGTENAANSPRYTFYGISVWSFTIDGSYVFPIAYNISGSNFVMLRDMGALLNFGVSFDPYSNNIYINTNVGYTPGL